MNETFQRYMESREPNTLSAIGRYVRLKSTGIENVYLKQKKALYGRYTNADEVEIAERIAREVVKSVDEILKERK